MAACNLATTSTVLNPYVSIQERLQLEDSLPYTEQWSAAPDFLNLLIDHCIEHKPSVILECSSGLSTLVLARCCQLNQHGKVLSLENGAEFAEATISNLESFGLRASSSVMHAPLRQYMLSGRKFEWYSTPDLDEDLIEMLVIDGPPGYIQEHSRYPALPLLRKQLSADCTIFLDDAAREQEKEIVDLWLQQFPDLTHTYVATERGCSILKFQTKHSRVS